jgi:hypothetical protein
LVIFKLKDFNKPVTKVASLEGGYSSEKLVPEYVDVSWSLLNARSFHLIGACGNMGVFIYKFSILQDEMNSCKFNLLEKVSLISLMPSKVSLFKNESDFGKPCRASWNYMVRVIRQQY